jgi:hypothetical protein
MMFEGLKFWKKKDEGLAFPKVDDGMGAGEPSPFGEEPKLPGFGPTDDLGLPKEPQPAFEPAPPPSFESQRMAQQPMQPQMQMQAPQYPPTQDHHSVSLEILSRDIAVLSSKMDALRSQMESIGQRVANIERVALDEEKKARSW